MDLFVVEIHVWHYFIVAFVDFLGCNLFQFATNQNIFNLIDLIKNIPFCYDLYIQVLI